MSRVVIPIDGVDDDAKSQLEYAVAFASEAIRSYRIDDVASAIIVECASEDACESVARHVNELVRRYQKRDFGLPSVVEFSNVRELPVIDAWPELLGRRWVTAVGDGQVVLRGPAAQLMRVIDARIDREFCRRFDAQLEVYPSAIRCSTLDRCKHFTAFPEHVDFIAHLRSDLSVLSDFAGDCDRAGWRPELHHGRMADTDLALSPSCCYHCYEAMDGWTLAPPGRCVTATLNCHRYEGANHKSLRRLRSFTMREVVWVGEPSYVMAARALAEQLILEWAAEWELAGTFETANDMFFTQDYAVKASFQRQQQAKKELRVQIPAEGASISVFSSNFHAVTFGRAFNIGVKDRPATSGCVGWGYERWVYAIFSQFGFDPAQWPSGLRRDWELQHGSAPSWTA